MNYRTYRKPSYLDQWLNNQVTSQASKAGKNTYQPQVNITEDDKGFELSLLVPGFDKTEISVNLQNGVLTVEAKLKEELAKSNYLRKQGKLSNFIRKFQLPDTIDEEGLNAHYAAGILSLHIPKQERVQLKKQITVQ